MPRIFRMPRPGFDLAAGENAMVANGEAGYEG